MKTTKNTTRTFGRKEVSERNDVIVSEPDRHTDTGQPTHNTMKKFLFTKGDQAIEIEAATYREALDDLIFQVGGEIKAAKFTFIESTP